MQQEYEHQQFLAWKTFPNVRSKNHGTLRPLKPSTNIINGLHNSLDETRGLHQPYLKTISLGKYKTTCIKQ